MLLISLSLHTSMLRVESLKVVEGHRRSFPDTRLTFQVKKVMGVGWWPVGLVSAPVPVPLLWTLDFRFETLDLDLTILCLLLYVSTCKDEYLCFQLSSLLSPLCFCWHRWVPAARFLMTRSAQRSAVTRRISAGILGNMLCTPGL